MLHQLLLGLLLLCGAWLLYTAAFSGPSRRVRSAVSKAKDYGRKRLYEQLLTAISSRIKRFVRISEYKRGEYGRMLTVLGMAGTPEDYMARTLAKTVLYFLLGAIMGVVSPVLVLLAPVFAVVIYMSELKTLKKKYTQRKTDIELELPKLCSVINSRLQSTSNVPAILTDFLPIANEAMSTELASTLTDMKTGNIETALRRFEGRISSPKVSDVVRGLIAVQNGDDMRVFFQSKQYQFNNDYITIKKKSVLMRPMKLGVPTMLAALFFGLVIFYPLLTGLQTRVTEFMS